MTPVYNPLKSPTNTMELMPEAEQRNDKNDLIIWSG
jgi:hypothetical protein